MASYMEIKGTTFSSFTVGKRGPVLTQVGTTGLDIDALDSDSITSGGPIRITAGSNSSALGDGGLINITGGTGSTTTGSGGDVTINGGPGSGSSLTSVGGNVSINGGTGGGGGGAITLRSGAGVSGAGDIDLIANNASGVGATGGDINLTAGLGENGGTVQIVGGNGLSGNGGDVLITAGDTTTASGGSIILTSGDGGGGINLAPEGTTAGATAELKFNELVANGTNSVGLKAPDAVATGVIWTLPDADGQAGEYLTTDGSGILSWASNTVYEVYNSSVQTLNGTPTTIGFNTERFANADFSLAGGVVTVARAGLYKVTYSVSSDSTNATRDITRALVYVNNAAYAASDSYGYHRNVGNGEGTATKTVLVQAAASDTIEVRAEILAGNGCVTIANQSNLVIERVGA